MIAITAQGERLDSKVDGRFGRCEYFILYDEQTKQYTAHPNPSRNASSGAGVGAAQFIVDSEVATLITGQVGPKAMRALKVAELDVYTVSKGTVETAISAYLNGELEQVNAATVTRN